MTRVRPMQLTAWALCAAFLFATGAAMADPAEEIAAAERAFALEARTTGAQAAFRRHVAPDGVGFEFDAATGRPKVVNAQAQLLARPTHNRLMPFVWWPAFVGVSLGGDLGYTSGPLHHVEKGPTGYIFTVWRKQADGSWKWIYDGGPPAGWLTDETEDAAVRLLPKSVRTAPPATAKAEVAALEQQIAAAATASSARALAPWLAADARVLGSGAAPARDPAGHAVEMAARPGRARLNLLGTEAASSGDLVLAYGEVLGVGEPMKLLAGYARIWQRRAEGWRIVYDQTLPPPPPPAPAP